MFYKVSKINQEDKQLGDLQNILRLEGDILLFRFLSNLSKKIEKSKTKLHMTLF